MRNRILIILTIAILLISAGVNAQVNSSPYSRYGIGDINSQVLGRSFGMGGISYGLRLPFDININNPASYTAAPQNVFLFQVGIKNKRTDFSTETQRVSNYDFSFESINGAFKINKYWAMSIGMTPVSSIGYNVQYTDSAKLDDYTSYFTNTQTGDGGISQIYLGNAFTYKGFSIGINTAYYFGTITKRLQSYLDNSTYYSILEDSEDIKIKDFNIRYGFQYSDTISSKYNLTVGGFFENKSELKADFMKFSGQTITIIGAGTVTDTIINDTIQNGLIELPVKYGVGFSFVSKKMILGADYEKGFWSGKTFMQNEQEFLIDNYKISLGAEFTQDYASKEYFKTLNYRIGAYYGTTNLYLNETAIKDAGITFGIGIPTKSGTKVNIGFGIGQRGITNNDLIKENYYTINLNINMADQWFVRRKFF